MNALIPFAAIGLFAAGVTAGIIGMVTVAIRREEKNLTLASAAADHVTRAGRWLNGVGLRAPRRAAYRGDGIARDDIARWLESSIQSGSE
jgi:hypothetical protein